MDGTTKEKFKLPNGKDATEIATPVASERLVSLQCNIFICATARRELVVHAGMFDEENGNEMSEDFDLWLRIVKKGGRIAYRRQVLARYRRRSGSITFDPIAVYQRILRVFEKMEQAGELTPAQRAMLKRERTRYGATLRLTEGKQALSRNDVAAAIDGFNDANAFFHSRQFGLALLLMRLSPKLLYGVYQLRNRFIIRTATRV